MYNFQIDVSLPDDNKPTFEQTSYSGYISQGDLDNGKLTSVTTDIQGRNPLRLLVSDADDPDVSPVLMFLIFIT